MVIQRKKKGCKVGKMEGKEMRLKRLKVNRE